MPPKKFTRNQLRVTDIHQSDDSLQGAALTAEMHYFKRRPTVRDCDDDDDDLYYALGGERNKDTPFDIHSGDLSS